ncbi:MAG: hypothetical protein QOF14_957 [Hyphomicrobiales bacterium]|jgi:hypothetical protein|nr:hypothetical protein [Hyphomicrobiales bacterium]
MLVQLNPPLHMETPKGKGWAHFCIDYGPEMHLLWVVFMDADGACWTVPNPEIRLSPNWSMGRRPSVHQPKEQEKAARFRPTLATATDT